MDINKHNKYSKELVDMWGDYIDWEKRREGENGFLLQQIRKESEFILDAALGDGADSIYLNQHFSKVYSNEVEEEFIKKARENSEKNKVNLHIREYDWKDFNIKFTRESFGTVLCLGNSFSSLLSKEDQQKTLDNFLYILQKNGRLIIDERNYQYILDKKDDILEKDIFKYSGKYVYCGDKITSKPVEITDNRVKMEYSNKKGSKKEYLDYYPFKKNELIDLLKETGFQDIQQYSDYEKGYNPKADYYQYVCQK